MPFGIDKQSVALPGEHCLSCSQLPIVFCLGLRPCGLSLFHITMPVGVIAVLVIFKQPCWWNFMALDSDISRRHSLTANFLILLFLQFFCCLLPCFLSLNCGSCIAVISVGMELHNSAFLLVVGSCAGLCIHILNRSLSSKLKIYFLFSYLVNTENGDRVNWLKFPPTPCTSSLCFSS